MSKKITLAKMNSIIAPALEKLVIPFTNEDGEIIKIELNQKITPHEAALFTNRVLCFCFDEDNNYTPEYMETGLFTAVLQILSNIPVPKRKDVEYGELVDTAVIENWAVNTDLLHKIRNSGSPLADTLQYLESILKEKIKFKQDSIHCEQKKLLAECKGVIEIEQTEILSKMDSLVSLFGSLADGLEGTDSKQLTTDIHTLANMDETKITDSVLKFKDPVAKEE